MFTVGRFNSANCTALAIDLVQASTPCVVLEEGAGISKFCKLVGAFGISMGPRRLNGSEATRGSLVTKINSSYLF